MTAFIKREKKRKTLADSDTREDMIIDVLSDIIVRDLERDADTAPTPREQSICRSRFKDLSLITDKFDELTEAEKFSDGAYHPHPRYEGIKIEDDAYSRYKGHRHGYGNR